MDQLIYDKPMVNKNIEKKELELISVSKTAELMHIGKERLYALMNAGKIGWILMGKKRFIPYSEILRYIKENTQFTTNATNVFEWSDKSSISGGESTDFDTMELFNKLKGELING